MATYVSKILSSLFPNQERRLLCGGLDATGKTAWLYMQVLGELVTTIPTIGFNVETIKHNGASFTTWDVGGCDKIRPLWRHYFQNTDGIVFFIDANDRDRMDEAGEELRRIMSSPELVDTICLVIANKQDLPHAMPAGQVAERLKLAEALRNHTWAILPGCMEQKEYLRAHMDWLDDTLRQRRRGGTPAPKPGEGGTPSGSNRGAGAAQQPGAPDGGGGSEPDILERWLQVEDEPDDEFLRKLEDFTLDTWDHRAHLRLAWLYLRRNGRREGLARIHASIQAFIAHSPVTKRKTGTTYHETMTYFWAHMVHFAMESMKPPPGAISDFKLFLLLNPQLTNGGLFLHYYTRKLMLEYPEARTSVVLPDKRPLPSILTDIASLSIKPLDKRQPGPPSAGQLLDAEFMQRFADRTLDKWNHECLLRLVYCCLKEHGRRRGGNIALDELRGLQKEAFHLTINYFWVCMITHTLVNEYSAALFKEGQQGGTGAAASGSQATEGGEGATTAGGEGGTVASGGRVRALGPQLPDWPSLLHSSGYTSVRLKELVADEKHYLKYYTPKVIFVEVASAQFVPPDKRPLPSTA